MNDESVIKFEDLKRVIGITHITDTAQIAHAMLVFHKFREQQYDRSFARRGEVGVFMNLARKFDRIETSINSGFEDITTFDAIADMAIYALKWMDIFCKIHRSIVIRWLEEVYCPTTGKTISEAYEDFGLSNESQPG